MYRNKSKFASTLARKNKFHPLQRQSHKTGVYEVKYLSKKTFVVTKNVCTFSDHDFSKLHFHSQSFQNELNDNRRQNWSYLQSNETKNRSEKSEKTKVHKFRRCFWRNIAEKNFSPKIFEYTFSRIRLAIN